MLGMGAMVGTGVFVSIGIGAGIAGPAVIISIALAALLAGCNGLSSAQLAASHAVSGGTYEYGYRYASPSLGFLAGWMFLWAKSASAATAALGFAGYALNATSWDPAQRVPLALAVIGLLLVVVLTGMRRTNIVNAVIVSITISTLAFFIIAGLPRLITSGGEHLQPMVLSPENPGRFPIAALLHAAALMFVAFTGYGRIATLGEEVHQPKQTIPRAIMITLLAAMVIYILVAVVGIGAVGAAAFAQATKEQAAPLEIIARTFDVPGISNPHWILAVGAVTAMAGVLLNLILGLSRVLLAMARRGDMPQWAAKLTSHDEPVIAVVIVTAIIASIVLVGDVRVAWSMSALAVLIYYAITNICALRMPDAERLYPRWIAWCGLGGCLGLAFFVDAVYWLIGLGVLGAGLMWFAVANKMRTRHNSLNGRGI